MMNEVDLWIKTGEKKSLRMPSKIRATFLCLVLIFGLSSSQDIRSDPSPILYQGQVNIGLISNLHTFSNTSGGCGTLRPEAVQKAMAAVWAAHQANFMKDDPQELNIGIYIYDTCGRDKVAERQVYRLLGHVGHVGHNQNAECVDKKGPPLFAVMTEGDVESLTTPLKLLDAFSVPVVSTSGPSSAFNSSSHKENFLSTAPSTSSLARGAVMVLRQLRLLEVAVIAEDSPQSTLFEEFSRQAMVSGMQAIPVEQAVVTETDNFLASLKIVTDYGKSRLKAVVFLLGPEQALNLLRSIEDSNIPQIPWVIVTTGDVASSLLSTFKRHQLRRLTQVLLLSPETTEIPEFQDYFRQLLAEDTIKYHSLLIEFLQNARRNSSTLGFETTTTSPWRTTTLPPIPLTGLHLNLTHSPTNSHTEDLPPFPNADVAPTVKAVWALASALKMVQRRSCRRGTDCLLYLRRNLSSYVARAAAALDLPLDVTTGTTSFKGSRLRFDEDGALSSVRYGLKGFTARGDIQEVGYFSDDSGLVVYHELKMPFNGFIFTEPPRTTGAPDQDDKFKLKPDRVLPKPTLQPTPSETPEKTTPAEILAEVETEAEDLVPGDYDDWKILDDLGIVQDPGLQEVPDEVEVPSEETTLKGDLSSTLNHVSSVQNLAETPNREAEQGVDVVVLGPSYRSEQEASSNLRSISLTSHNEPRINNAYKSGPPRKESSLAEETPSIASSSSTTNDVKVVKSLPTLHVSAWLGRPWALSILGICGFLLLATLYVLVFLLVKSCEGSLKKTDSCLSVCQLLSLLCLYVAAALYTWKPSDLLCGLQRLIPNIGFAFCYGCLLLKAMSLRAQNSLGLGGSINRCNQLLTLIFVVGVQVALETQWWLMRPPTVSPDNYECLITKTVILSSQGYIYCLLLLTVALAVSTRRVPYNQTESKSLMATTIACLAIMVSWCVACWLLPDSLSRNIAAPSALVATALAVLAGVFGPQLFAIHKYGGFPHKPLSYADSLSTVFTMFKDLDSASGGGTTARGKKNAKTLETPFAPADLGEGTRNPLYNDYQSAYP